MFRIRQASAGGEVGASCGCIGCFDEFDEIQGSWQHVRQRKKGSFHATDYASLVCGCDGVFDGALCNAGNPEPGPDPLPAPANMACFSGVGDFKVTRAVKRTQTVAFRVEVEDRGEPAVGSDATADVYRIRIWVPAANEDVKTLVDSVCCRNADPVAAVGRAPDIDDGGNLIYGNIQIQVQTGDSEDAVCPVPQGICQE